MNQPDDALDGADRTMPDRLSAVARQSERTILLGAILLLSAASTAIVFGLIQYFRIEAFTALVYEPDDCYPGLDWGPTAGLHCFSDYGWASHHGMQSNPWDPHPLYEGDVNDYTAGALLAPLFFALPTGWLHVPALGLVAYLLVLMIAVLYPAVWAARGARGLERVVVFVACGAAAIPAWAAIDRGNSTGFLAAIGLVFLVALCRRRWGVVAIAVVLAALVKPQFVVLTVVLLAARQWRLGGIAVAGAVTSNVAAYLLWPQDFPETIIQSIRNTLSHGSVRMGTTHEVWNVSFAKVLFALPDYIAARYAGGEVPGGFLAVPRSLIGYVVLAVVVVCVLVLGRRIPPVMAGVVLLATASLIPAFTYSYYLVFALPIAALVARDPDGAPGSGIFDRFRACGDRRRAVFVCVSVAAAVSIAQFPIPVPSDDAGFIPTTAVLTPVLWLVACAAIIVSYARRPAPQDG